MNEVIASPGGMFPAVGSAFPDNPYQRDFRLAVRAGNKPELERILGSRDGGTGGSGGSGCGVNVNLFDPDGQSALHESCLDGNFDLVKVLVESGADVRLANRDGWSALHIAAYGGHHDIVIYLIAANRRAKHQS